MTEIIRIEDRYYILATSSLADETTRDLKHGDTFLVTDRHGDIRPLGFEKHGLFHAGTRFLSRLVLKFDDVSPLLLGSTVREDNDLLSVDLTNQDFESGAMAIGSGRIHASRSVFLLNGCLYERIKILNFALEPVDFTLSIEFEADFADIFEVRGIERARRGEAMDPSVDGSRVVLSYAGLDGIIRKTRIDVSPVPCAVDPARVAFPIMLGPRQEEAIYMTIACETSEEAVVSMVFDQAFEEIGNIYRSRRRSACAVETSNEQFNDWLNRSRADLNMMLTPTCHGLYPYAGIPWYSTVFGRDGIITAMETLWMQPEIARGVLDYLAAEQATGLDPEKDAEPGKILHEMRMGEMAALGEVPFGRYYGSVDSVPLFVVLAGFYHERTGDTKFLREIWPNIEMALKWMDDYGDVDGDGFIEYSRKADGGLANQGWKDSWDSVFHADGTLAHGPIALSEVQGYVHEAKIRAARLASLIGDEDTARRLIEEAGLLKERFHKSFWIEELGTYAIALDGDKRPCRVRTSNAGHILFTGIVEAEYARRTVEGLMEERFFAGWGIRTVASTEARYNPMSYHNGSVWPHDNALIAWGMSKCGFKEEAVRVMTGLFDASLFMDLHRLPELFCGFTRRPGEGPTLYPVACDPQSWASAAVYMLIQACLGLSIDAGEKKVYFNSPLLPPFLEEVRIRDLYVEGGSLDIDLKRYEKDVGVNVAKREGDVDVVVVKQKPYCTQ